MINGHGGNIYQTAEALGCRPGDILDMSSNINPLGPIAELMDALQGKLGLITRLPEVSAQRICRLFAEQCRLDPLQVLAGNGTTEFIYALPQALGVRRALIVGPTYADYESACRMHGVDYDYLSLEESDSFVFDPGRCDARLDQADTMFICNPNNPTGSLVPGNVLKELCRRHPRCRFIIDESYLPFVPGADSHTMAHLPSANIIVLNSMSKIFRIPGIRIGFLAASKENIEPLKRFVRPWSVNSLAQAAADYLMTHPAIVKDFMVRTWEYLGAEKDKLFERLGSLALTLFPSSTGFVLARLTAPMTAGIVIDHLLKDRILIRNCANFHGLSDAYIRLSLKTPEANRLLADRLTALFV